MIGRWTGAIAVFNNSKIFEKLLYILVPYLAFVIILYANKLSGFSNKSFAIYNLYHNSSNCIFKVKDNPQKTLKIFSI